MHKCGKCQETIQAHMNCANCDSFPSNDPIKHPAHYTQGIETIDYILSWRMNYLEGNIIKYVTRYKYKGGLEDLKKAQWYIERLIEESAPAVDFEQEQEPEGLVKDYLDEQGEGEGESGA